MKLERNADTPLHLQIQAFLRERILSNKLKSDEHIPSERDLAEELSVSRMTVRQALNALREEGLIYQKRGRGTFVSSMKMDIHTRNLEGFSEEMIRRGMKPESRILEMTREKASKEVVDKLDLKAGEEVILLKRLRLADNMPMSIETTYLPSEKFPGLDKANFQKESLYQVLEKEYGIRMSSAAEVLEAAISDEKTSELLGVSKNSPLLIVYRTVFIEGNVPIEYTKSIYRADRYRASFFMVKK